MTNFRLFQTERVRRRQLFSSMKIAESYQIGRKTLGKGEIAHYKHFLLFSQCFQKTCTADT